jgi:hypothetical protein
MSVETLICVGLLLISQRRFWVLVFFAGGLASFFGMIVSIFDSEKLDVLGFFILMAVCWFVTVAIARPTRRFISN